MTRVLIVEDEPTSRSYLEKALLADGYEVSSAESGVAAIRVAKEFRPDVLIADWMLKNRYHGLEVAEALNQVNPVLQTILVTGFPSIDLRDEARDVGVLSFIEKPFSLAEVEAAIGQAVHDRPRRRPVTLGLVELDAQGSVLFANARARALFARARAGTRPVRITEVFEPDVMKDLAASRRAWLAARPLSDAEIVWRVRLSAPRADGTRTLILQDVGDEAFRTRNVVDALLEVESSGEGVWPFESGLLIVDGDAASRRSSVRLLRTTGANCYAASNRAEALRILRGDERVKVVLVDAELGPDELASLREEVRGSHDAILLIGTSDVLRGKELARLGIERFLRKPWTLSELIRQIEGAPH